MTLKNQENLFKNLNADSSLREIQSYINEVSILRGFSEQSVKDKLLLLMEEVGELTKAIRKSSVGASVDYNKIDNYDSVESEIADVFFMLNSVANMLNIDIFECLKEKEMINKNRVWKINQ